MVTFVSLRGLDGFFLIFHCLIFRQFLSAGKVLSLPKTGHDNSLNTCSNDFYLTFLMRCWSKPADRRPSFTELLKDLKEKVVPSPGDYFMYSQKRLDKTARLVSISTSEKNSTGDPITPNQLTPIDFGNSETIFNSKQLEPLIPPSTSVPREPVSSIIPNNN